MNCKWLPPFYKEPDWNNYAEYEEELYNFFKYVYLKKHIIFNGKIIKYRYEPRFNGKEEIFYHLICKITKEASEKVRNPDKDRIIRIEWPKAFIENYNCNYDCCKDKPMYWVKENRHKIFYKNYLVIIEERNTYFLLITGFYVEDDYYRVGLIKEYKKYK